MKEVKLTYATDPHYNLKALERFVEHANQNGCTAALIGGDHLEALPRTDLRMFTAEYIFQKASEAYLRIKVVLSGLDVPYFIWAGNYDSRDITGVFLKTFLHGITTDIAGLTLYAEGGGNQNENVNRLAPKQSFIWGKSSDDLRFAAQFKKEDLEMFKEAIRQSGMPSAADRASMERLFLNLFGNPDLYALLSHYQPDIIGLHRPVFGIADTVRRDVSFHIGSVPARQYIRKAKKKPAIVLTGHVHDCPETRQIDGTVVHNPGSLEGSLSYPRFSSVILDMEKERPEVKEVRQYQFDLDKGSIPIATKSTREFNFKDLSPLEKKVF